MSTLTIPDISPAALARLGERAAAAGRTVEEEAQAVIEDWAFRPGNDDTGPLDFERPITGPVIRAEVVVEVERLPALPVILELTPE